MEVSKDFVEEALNNRFTIAQDNWGSVGTFLFWEKFKTIVMENPIGPTAKWLVDSYVVNSVCDPVSTFKNEDESIKDCKERLINEGACAFLIDEADGDEWVMMDWGLNYA